MTKSSDDSRRCSIQNADKSVLKVCSSDYYVRLCSALYSLLRRIDDHNAILALAHGDFFYFYPAVRTLAHHSAFNGVNVTIDDAIPTNEVLAWQKRRRFSTLTAQLAFLKNGRRRPISKKISGWPESLLPALSAHLSIFTERRR